jgi:hypothetical protein
MQLHRVAATLLAAFVLVSAARGDTISAYWPDGLGYHLKTYYDDDGAGAHTATKDTVPVGMYFWEPTAGSNNPSPFNKSFVSFCIDVDQYVQTPSVFTLKPLEQAPNSDGPGAYGSGPSGTFMSHTQADLLRELWGEQYAYLRLGTETQQNDKCAAFQLAIWEILFESSATKDASNGYLKVVYSGAKPTYVTLANQFLASTYDSGYSALETRLGALTSATGQDHLVLVPIPTAVQAGATLLAAIMGIRVRRRRFDENI